MVRLNGRCWNEKQVCFCGVHIFLRKKTPTGDANAVLGRRFLGCIVHGRSGSCGFDKSLNKTFHNGPGDWAGASLSARFREYFVSHVSSNSCKQ